MNSPLQLQLKLHSTSLHHTASCSCGCGWGDHCNHSKNHNHFPVYQWVRSAIHASQQLTSPLFSYLWNFRHRLVRYYWHIHAYCTLMHLSCFLEISSNNFKIDKQRLFHCRCSEATPPRPVSHKARAYMQHSGVQVTSSLWNEHSCARNKDPTWAWSDNDLSEKDELLYFVPKVQQGFKT